MPLFKDSIKLQLKRVSKEKEPFYVTFSGTVHPPSNNSNLKATFKNSYPFLYSFLDYSIPVDNIEGSFKLKNEHIIFNSLKGIVLDGFITMNIEIDQLFNLYPKFAINLNAKKINVKKFSDKYLSKENSSTGFLDGKLDLEGKYNKIDTISGKGSMIIEGGQLFTVPIFGLLSNLINDIIPGSGYTTIKTATGSCNIENGLLNFQDFTLGTSFFNIASKGSIDFPSKSLNINAKIKPKGATKFILIPLTKIIEYEASGPINKPSWKRKLKIIPIN